MNRSQRRRLRTQVSLLAAIRYELSINAVDSVIVHDVTERADVALGTFYNHFDDKAAAIQTLARVDTLILGRHVAEIAAESPDNHRWATATVVVLVQRASVDRVWVASLASLVNAGQFPTAAAMEFLESIPGRTGEIQNQRAWRVQVFVSVMRGMIHHLAAHGFDGSIEERITLGVRSILGGLAVDQDVITAEIEFATAVPLRTEWPDDDETILTDETLHEAVGFVIPSSSETNVTN
ncbi:MAG: TetR/AcrR family transcriptional regulator [Actinobacteria bacterium]|nr:TetR/AcrR family transcriptional regulator [Actinomycetota bacterium]